MKCGDSQEGQETYKGTTCKLSSLLLIKSQFQYFHETLETTERFEVQNFIREETFLSFHILKVTHDSVFSSTVCDTCSLSYFEDSSSIQQSMNAVFIVTVLPPSVEDRPANKNFLS